MRTLLATAAIVATAALATPVYVLAQGAPQTVQLAKLDVVKVATGYRASKVIGATVVNEANDTVGKVDDVIIGQDGKSPYAVLSVGGFLGIGARLVAVPLSELRFNPDGERWVLSGATRETLQARPPFSYQRRG